jgi:sialate O-acetylesterase
METTQMGTRIGYLWLMTLVLALGTLPAYADVHVSGIFGSNMVLQRDKDVPIWGTATPAEKVIVRFAGQSAATQAGPDGKWEVQLKPMKASDQPQTLTIAGTNTITLDDILIGEVWICSGQSNMELTPSKGLLNPAVEIAAAHWPKIRLILVHKVVSDRPLSDVQGSWGECTPQTMAQFSAAAYFFGREILQKIGVPVGLVGIYYGGSNGQAWVRRAALEADPDLATYVTQAEARLPVPAPDADASGPPVGLPPSTNNPVTSRYRPSNFYNGMVAPLIPFAMRGVIWYQGESNTNNARDAGLYAKLFITLITDWRAQWGVGDFPFLFVQLPACEPRYPDPTDSAWARLRESQQKALALKNTAMDVTIDLGEGEAVHAHNKRDVGLRLAALALNQVYDKKDMVAVGPMLQDMTVKDGQATLHFADPGGGLIVKDPNGLKGFAVAGADQTFVWADAKIVGDTVVVSSAQVSAPVAVRYAWADNPEVGLFSKSGLPAAPFRTDDWPAVKISNPRAAP